jgi:hypothetical protein
MTHASRSANQSKPEPFPASATESEAETPGATEPQQPGSPVTAGRSGAGDTATVPATGDEPAAATSEELPVVQGLHVPEVDEPDPRT